VAWSVRLVAVGFTAVTLTAGGAAYAAAAGTGHVDPVRWAQDLRWTISWVGQHHTWGQGAIRWGGSEGSGQPQSTPQLGQPVPAGAEPQSQTGGHRARSSPRALVSPTVIPQPSPRASSDPSMDPSRSGGSGRTGRHPRPGG